MMSKGWNSSYVGSFHRDPNQDRRLYNVLHRVTVAFSLSAPGLRGSQAMTFLSPLGLEVWSVHSDPDLVPFDF